MDVKIKMDVRKTVEKEVRAWNTILPCNMLNWCDSKRKHWLTKEHNIPVGTSDLSRHLVETLQPPDLRVPWVSPETMQTCCCILVLSFSTNYSMLFSVCPVALTNVWLFSTTISIRDTPCRSNYGRKLIFLIKFYPAKKLIKFWPFLHFCFSLWMTSLFKLPLNDEGNMTVLVRPKILNWKTRAK